MAIDKQYFKLPNVPLMAVLIAALILLFCAFFNPSVIPYSYLGPLGVFVKYLVTDWPIVINLLVILTILSHTVEAYFSYHTAVNKGLESPATYKWCLAVGSFGYFAYRHLLAYEPDKDK